MKQKILFGFTCGVIFFGSFVVTTKVLADIVYKTMGTPSCNLFNDQSGTRCYELKCNFTGSDRPLNYDKCETSDGTYEDSRTTRLYSVQMCEFTSCQHSTDVLKCETKPPADANVISYSYELCDGTPKLDIAEIKCPIKCKKCTTPPSVFGTCPQGTTKIDGCCLQGTLCTGQNDIS